ncbi:MAG: type-F conjugative transfer system secretin TraK [Sphingomonadales bacterium]
MMKKMIFTLLAVTALSTSAHALQIKQSTDNGQITALVSAQEISRISLVKDRIRMVNGDPEVDITHDSETWDIYVKPVAAPLSKPINLFISTEKGFTYQLLLMPEKAPSEQIIIRNEDAFDGSKEAQSWESKTPFHATIIDVLKSTIGEANLPAGYKKEVFRKESADAHGHLLLSRKFAITGAALQGIALEVRNTGKAATALNERDLYSPDQAAIYIPQRKLEPGAKATVYLVRRRAEARP